MGYNGGGAYHRNKTGYLNPQMSNYSYSNERAEIERKKEATRKSTEHLPDDAFADDVITNDKYGSFNKLQTIVETSLWHYD